MNAVFYVFHLKDEKVRQLLSFFSWRWYDIMMSRYQIMQCVFYSFSLFRLLNKSLFEVMSFSSPPSSSHFSLSSPKDFCTFFMHVCVFPSLGVRVSEKKGVSKDRDRRRIPRNWRNGNISCSWTVRKSHPSFFSKFYQSFFRVRRFLPHLLSHCFIPSSSSSFDASSFLDSEMNELQSRIHDVWNKSLLLTRVQTTKMICYDNQLVTWGDWEEKERS
jgi:hypothetical protein